MNITIEMAIKLFSNGTATIGHNGKLYFTKEKAVRRQPNDVMVLSKNSTLNIPRFF